MDETDVPAAPPSGFDDALSDDEEDMAADGRRKRGDRSPSELDARIGKQLKDHRESLPGRVSRAFVADELSLLHPESPWHENRLGRIELAEYRLTYSDIHVLLDYYRLVPGVFYQQVGAIILDDSVISRLENDPFLDPTTRKLMVGMYRDATGLP